MKSKLIFIVDDDESVCRALGILLDTYGFRVEAFVCAKDFFNAVPNSAAVCLLLDIHMPGLDGWETLQRLSKSVSSLPVIIMSAEKKEGFNEKKLDSEFKGNCEF